MSEPELGLNFERKGGGYAISMWPLATVASPRMTAAIVSANFMMAGVVIDWERKQWRCGYTARMLLILPKFSLATNVDFEKEREMCKATLCAF